MPPTEDGEGGEKVGDDTSYIGGEEAEDLIDGTNPASGFRVHPDCAIKSSFKSSTRMALDFPIGSMLCSISVLGLGLS